MFFSRNLIGSFNCSANSRRRPGAMDARGLAGSNRILRTSQCVAVIHQRRIADTASACRGGFPAAREACRNSRSSGSRSAAVLRRLRRRPAARRCAPLPPLRRGAGTTGGRRRGLPPPPAGAAPSRSTQASGNAAAPGRRARPQLRQVAAHRQLAAVLVDHLEIHEQVRRQGLQLEVGSLQRDLRSARARRRSAPRAGRPRRSAGALCARRSPRRTRAAARNGGAASAAATSAATASSPSACPAPAIRSAPRVDLVQRVQRHRERHAVARRARLEVVASAPCRRPPSSSASGTGRS